MPTKLRIGVLTGGGDVPGLNQCIKAFTTKAIEAGHEVVGFRRGWRGLSHVQPSDPASRETWTLPLTRARVRTVDRYGGTFLHTSRTNPAKMKSKDLPDHLRPSGAPGAAGSDDARVDVTPTILSNLAALEIDALMVIGGDDTLSYAGRLHREGFPTVAVPKTMDNDVMGTDYCIGFSTAVTRSVNFITDLRTPAGSHERFMVVELFGRYSGETALLTGYLAGADRVVISEVPCDVARLTELLASDKANSPSHYAVLVVSEGARLEGGDMALSGETDAYGHRKLGGIGDVLGFELKRRTGDNVMVQRLAYLMRAGAPDSLDRLVAYSFGSLAFDLIATGEHGRMVAIQQGRYTAVPVEIATTGRRQVDVSELYNSQEYLPKIRDVRGKPMFLY